MWRIWSVLFIVLAVVSLILLASTVILTRALCLGKPPRRLHTWMIRGWDKAVFRILGIRVVVEGREHDRPNEPSLVVSNHQSLLDIPAAFAALGGHVRMVSKKELAYVPFFGWGMAASEMIFVSRGSPQSRARAAKLIANRIRSGIRVWVAPEGTRSADGSLGAFRPGSFAMAIEAQSWVQPLVVKDAYRILPKNSFLPRPLTTLHLKVLPAISTKGMTSVDAPALMERVHADMSRALNS